MDYILVLHATNAEPREKSLCDVYSHSFLKTTRILDDGVCGTLVQVQVLRQYPAEEHEDRPIPNTGCDMTDASKCAGLRESHVTRFRHIAQLCFPFNGLHTMQ